MTLSIYFSSGLSAISLLTFFLVLQPPGICSLKHNHMLCDQLSECVCAYPSDEGVNLTNLASPFMFNDTQHKLVFHYSPCLPLKEPAHCSGATFCVEDEEKNATTFIASKAEILSSPQGLDNPIYMNYQNAGIVQLECSTNHSFLLNSVQGLKLDFEAKYILLLRAPEACLQPVTFVRDGASDGGISTGSVIVILFLVFFSVYLLVGAAAKHFLQGASGLEMIPNYEFWRRLPTALMDGLKFVANGCRPPPSYEQI